MRRPPPLPTPPRLSDEEKEEQNLRIFSQILRTKSTEELELKACIAEDRFSEAEEQEARAVEQEQDGHRFGHSYTNFLREFLRFIHKAPDGRIAADRCIN